MKRRDIRPASVRVVAALVAAAGLCACGSGESRSIEADRQRLLLLHEAGLQAHRDGDVEALLRHQAEDFYLVDGGAVEVLSKQQRREFLGPYLAATRFEFYRDAAAPVASVAGDGSLGWVTAQVEARGSTVNAAGEPVTIEFAAAWIELYERRGEEWLAVGNASSIREKQAE